MYKESSISIGWNPSTNDIGAKYTRIEQSTSNGSEFSNYRGYTSGDKPDQNIRFVGRDKYLNLIQEYFVKNTYSPNYFILHGIGGIGKTQIANEYIYRSNSFTDKKIYDRIFWVCADKVDKFYSDLAREYDLKYSDYPYKKKILHKKILESQFKRILWVFDDVKDQEYFNKYCMCSEILKLFNQFTGTQIDVLITSQSRNWLGKQAMTIEEFTLEETLQFISNILGNNKNTEHYSNETSIKKLYKEMVGLPLAIAQAICTIFEENISIDRYLDEYRKADSEYKKKIRYLDKSISELDKYAKTVWKTFNVAVKYLDKKPLLLLEILSYLEPDNIHSSIFESIWGSDTKIYINKLSKFSLITYYNDLETFRIHKLLHKVLQIKYQNKAFKRMMKNYAFSKILGLLNEAKEPFYNQDFSQAKKFIHWLPHVLAIKKHIHEKNMYIFLNELGHFANVLSEYNFASEINKEYIAICNNATDLNSKKKFIKDKSYHHLFALYNYSSSLVGLEEYDGAVKIVNKCLKIITSQFIDNRLPANYAYIYINLLDNLGAAYSGLGESEKAESIMNRALLLRKKLTIEHPLMKQELAEAQFWLANTKANTGKYEEAEKLYEYILSILDVDGTGNHPKITNILNNLSAVKMQLGKTEEARNLLDRNSQLLTNQSGFQNNINHAQFCINKVFDFINSFNSNINEETKFDRYSDAANYLKKAMHIQKKIYGMNHINIAEILMLFGAIETLAGNFELAQDYLSQSLEILGGNKNHTNYLKIMQNVAECYIAKVIELIDTFININMNESPKFDRYSDAANYLGKAMHIQKEIHGKNHINIAKILMLFGTIEIFIAKYELAQDYLNQSLEILEKNKNHTDYLKVMQDIKARQKNFQNAVMRNN